MWQREIPLCCHDNVLVMRIGNDSDMNTLGSSRTNRKWNNWILRYGSADPFNIYTVYACAYESNYSLQQVAKEHTKVHVHSLPEVLE